MLDPYRAHWVRVPFVIATAVSLVILFTPASGVPTAPPGTDELVHFLLFAVLAITGRLARVPAGPLLVGLVCYAGVSEILQAVLPLGRSGDVGDAVVDVLGLVVGLLGSLVLPTARRIPR